MTTILAAWSGVSPRDRNVTLLATLVVLIAGVPAYIMVPGA